MADNVAVTAGTGTTISTDERTIAAASVHVQRVIDIGSSAVANGQVTVTNTAGNIVAARDTRKSVTIINHQTVAVYVGVATVTTSTGVRLEPEAGVTLATTAAVQGITSSAYTPTGDAKVHYIEEYDA